MMFYKRLKILLVISLLGSALVYAKRPPIKAITAKPALGVQPPKTSVEREDKNAPGIINDLTGAYTPEEDEEWEEEEENQQPATGLRRDFSEMGSEIKGAVDKHNFTLGNHPYSIQGLPIVYTSKSTGLNLGLRLSLSDLKNEQPYIYQFNFQFWVSDRGAKNHEVSLDIPEFFSRHWRLKLTYKYPEVIDNNFFGIGNDSVFDKNFSLPQGSNFLSRTYYQYTFIYPRFTVNLSYKFFRERFNIYGGIGLDKATIKPNNYDNRSKIYTEKPYGYDGGKTNYIKGGIRYDSRDYPMNPTRGIVLSGTYTNHAKFMGSDYQYSNIDATYMGFFSFWKYFTLAHRILTDQVWGDLPFFALAQFNSYEVYEGLGGDTTLRGAPTYRFIDNLKFVNQIELRMKFYNGSVFGQHLELYISPFWDFGRVWDRHKKITFDQFHNTFGNEFRFTWNTNFIASFTVGVSKDAFSTYLTFGESFD